ncbi:hypothetical protein EW145_g4833 [Phellinidium pouzarii]|uniref:DUF6534 domain-containing protein n=1 Tax=Phellinidium pouzarii TaxID=167371 RepID=A0A4S4L2A7_9AGAM|nr:hypothetical protein EW145_g4833 [Phellinidium pouzarii]
MATYSRGSPVIAKLELGSTFGAAYIGAMLAMMLYGITCLQSYLYYLYYPKDRWSFKLLVATLCLGYSKPSRFASVLVSFGVETVANLFIIKDLTKLQTISNNSVLPFAFTAVIPDVLIAASLCFFLQSKKSDMRGTNTLIDQLIIYALNRCLVTSVVAIIEFVLYKTFQNKFYYIAADFCIGKLYANSLLATLNMRQSLRGVGYDNHVPSGGNTQALPAPNPSSAHKSNSLPKAPRGNLVELTEFRATRPNSIVTRESSSTHIDNYLSAGHNDDVNLAMPYV